MEIIEIFSLLGAPARVCARVLLFFRYPFGGHSVLQAWARNPYARSRYGAHYLWRAWLLFDIEELQRLEALINDGSDEDVLRLRDSQLDSFRLVAVVGALLAQTAISALSLPLLEQTHYLARGLFTLSLVLSLLAIFFTCIQQRELGFLGRPIEIRAWMSNGMRYQNFEGKTAVQSSMVSHQLLQAPYELTGISITLFIAGLGVYLGSAWAKHVALSVADGSGPGNVGVLSAFVAGTAFACMLFGFLVGRKSVETMKAGDVFEIMRAPGSSSSSQ